MAKFHGICIGMRRLHPQNFKEKFAPYMNFVRVEENGAVLLDVKNCFDSYYYEQMINYSIL